MESRFYSVLLANLYYVTMLYYFILKHMISDALYKQ